jgi:hypothetical protein
MLTSFMSYAPSSFADILNAVEAFETSEETRVKIKKDHPTQDHHGDFIDLQTFFVNFDIEEASLSTRRFSPQEIQVLDRISLGMMHSKVAGKWSYEHIEIMKHKAKKE